MAGRGKKFGLGCLSLIGLLLVVLFVGYLIFNEAKPNGTSGPKADALAEKMLVALNKPAWDRLRYIRFTFSNRNHYSWDKQNNRAVIESGSSRVIMNLNDQTGLAFEEEKQIEGKAKQEALAAAWSNWCNDSFWLYAPYKVFDPNTVRSIVKTEDGSEGLLIDYQGGGTTPGDSYLWVLDENNLPKEWKMWVKIIPLGGLKTSWEDWTSVATGAKIAQKHMLQSMNISITNLKSGQELEAIGYDENPFNI